MVFAITSSNVAFAKDNGSVRVQNSIYQARYSTEAYSNLRSNDINVNFEKLQMDIDNVLKVNNGRYVYNTQEVRRVIKDNNFNFNEFNKINKTDYTLESFTQEVLNLIEQVDFNKFVVSRGTSGVNRHEQGWNYHRYYNDYYKTLSISKILQDYSIGIASLTGLAGLLPFGNIFIGIVGGYGAAYCGLLSNALNYNNSLNQDGTVMDINKFTTVFSVWNQRYF